jgi:hypothetical protein
VRNARDVVGSNLASGWLAMKPIDELPRVLAPPISANKEFIDALARADARFLIVGGVAVKFYVPERLVEDLDLLIEPSPPIAALRTSSQN